MTLKILNFPQSTCSQKVRLVLWEKQTEFIIDVVEWEIPLDHIHMIVQSAPRVCPSEIMQVIKSLSARYFFKLHSELKKKKYFWGDK